MFSAQAFVKRIWDGPHDRIIELPYELQHLLEAAGTPELEAITLAERMLPRVRGLFSERIDHDVRKNVTPNFRFSETSDNRLIGVLMWEKDEKVKLKLRYRKELHKLINDLQWEKFENLCLLTLKLSGFSRYEIGRRRGDGGLDFFGLWTVQEKLGYKGVLTDVTLRIFGQAKHYAKRVSADEVRVFSTHFDDYQIGRGVAYAYVNSEFPWFVEAKGPLTPMVMTNGKFAKGAEDFANFKKIGLRDGSQIVEDIIRLAEPETFLSFQEGKYYFVPGKFEKCLDELTKKAC